MKSNSKPLASKKVAGMNVSKGNLSKRYKYRILRSNKVVKEGLSLSSLKFHKDEVNEIKKGQECGLSFFDFEDYKDGDLIEAYEIKIIQPSHSSNVDSKG